MHAIAILHHFQLDDVANMIAELEKSIARYKEEYAVLISEAQAIKADLAAVEAKVFALHLFVCLLILKIASLLCNSLLSFSFNLLRLD